MRTARRRFRRSVGLLLVAVSVGWFLLRRRGGSALPRPAVAPQPSSPVPPTSPVPPVPAAAAAAPVAPDVLATDAGLTAEPAAPDSAAEPLASRGVASETLVTDAGLTAEPAAAEPAAAEPAAAEPAAAAPEPQTPAPLAPGEVSSEVLATDAGLTAAGGPGAVGADDLRMIRGVGPAIERTLHGLGITTYRQVADMHGEELEAVRQRLEAFSARIEREDWVGQARELHRAKYGETL